MITVKTKKTKSARKTQDVARMLAREIRFRESPQARVIALEGNLGAGKTTFVQGFARALGIRERVASPTFVVMKEYALSHAGARSSQNKARLIHIDCYRLATPKDLTALGFLELLKDKSAIILIEWADRIRAILPKDAVWILFCHGEKANERMIRITK